MKRTIKLGESELRRMIAESVKRALTEGQNINSWLEYKFQIIKGAKGVISTSNEIVASSNNQYDVGTALLIKNCAKHILEYVNDLDTIITQNIRKLNNESINRRMKNIRHKHILNEEYDGYVSDSWWGWMDQYNEGKNGDDGANAIMEAATDLQEILEDENEKRILSYIIGECGRIFSYVECPEDKAWEESQISSKTY